MSENNNLTDQEMTVVVEDTSMTEAAEGTQDSFAGMLPEKPSKKKGWILAVAAAAVIIAVIILIVVSGASTPKKKVETALKNTFSHKSLLLEEINRFKGMAEGDYTVGMDIAVDDQQVAFEGRLTKEQFQVWAEVNMKEISGLEFWTNLTDSQLEVNIAELEDVLFTYNFREPKSGFLLEYAAKEDLEMLDEALILLSDLLMGENRESFMEKQEEANQKLTQIFLDEYVNMEFEEVDKASYEVGGKTLECKGYETVIASETIRKMMSRIKGVYEEYGMDYWSAYDVNSLDPFEDMDKALQELEELKLTFYLAKKQVAAIVMESEGEVIELLFGGDDADTWNMEMIYQQESVMELESTVEGKVEKINLKVGEVPVSLLTYDSESGHFDLSVQYYIPLLSASGFMEFSENEFNITLDEVISDYIPYAINFAYYAKQGAEIKELTGEEFDFTNAAKADLMSLYLMLEKTSIF